MWSGGIHGTIDDSALVLWGSGHSGLGTSAGHHVRGRSPYHVWELVVFILIAIVSGLVGASFNQINKRITIVRKRVMAGRPSLKGLEAILSIWLVISLFYA